MSKLKDGSLSEKADEAGLETLFRARYLEMVRLAGLLGADDPEDIAQEAFTRLLRKRPPANDGAGTAAYLRAVVCNLTRNRHRHLRVARRWTPVVVDAASSEQVVMAREDSRLVVAALAALPVRRREAIVLRYWLGLPEREIAQTMGVSLGTVKSQLSRGLAVVAQALEDTR